MSKPIQYNPRYPSIEDLRAKEKKNSQIAFEYLDGDATKTLVFIKTLMNFAKLR